MKRSILLLLISKFLAVYGALASNLGDETERKVPALNRINNRSVRDKVRMFEELTSPPSKSLDSQELNKTILSSPGHVRKISKFFQRSKSAEQLTKVQKDSSKTGSSVSAIIPSPSPKSPRNLFRLIKSREPAESPLNNKINKSQKGSKGSRPKPSKNVEVSAPSINTALTKQHGLNPESIEKDWEDRIRYLDMVKKTIEEHIKSGTINPEDEKYELVLKGDIAQLEEMYIKGMGYLHGKNSIRKHDPMMIASHLQNMKNLLDIVGAEIYWVAGEGKLTLSQLTLFETKLLDAREKTSFVNKSSETLESPRTTCVTRPNRTRRHTTQD